MFDIEMTCRVSAATKVDVAPACRLAGATMITCFLCKLT
ncbi:MAG: hypothetical protein KCHDKBKB_02828 [Elusimicrobia bacterium]|nr:hypothetical protein [Elusimicrobiota bacterium]